MVALVTMSGPRLVTVTVKLTWSPTLIRLVLAVLLTARSARNGRTVTAALAVLLAELVSVAVEKVTLAVLVKLPAEFAWAKMESEATLPGARKLRFHAPVPGL